MTFKTSLAYSAISLHIMNQRLFIRLGWATLVVIFLVIIAGSVVRATGSGMGCPDWPKCFGHIIPPTQEDQVVFKPNTSYNKDQMIVDGNRLLQANDSFTSKTRLNEQDWTVYEKHDYAIFNPTHTWIEYINRLLGALSGFFLLAFWFWSILLALRKQLPVWIPFAGLFALILLGFQAWLGKTVVDSNLEGSKITAHLFGALALVAVMQLIIRFSYAQFSFSISAISKRIAWIAFFVFAIQLALGTEFRVLVDEWTADVPALFLEPTFKLHRSFAWVVLLISLWLFYSVWKTNRWKPVFTMLFTLLLAEIILGIILSTFDLPAVAQPLHLLVASLLFAGYIWVILARTSTKK